MKYSAGAHRHRKPSVYWEMKYFSQIKSVLTLVLILLNYSVLSTFFFNPLFIPNLLINHWLSLILNILLLPRNFLPLRISLIFFGINSINP